MVETRTKTMEAQALVRFKDRFARFIICNNPPTLVMAARTLNERRAEVAIQGDKSDLDYIENKHSPGGWEATEQLGDGWQVYASSVDPATIELT